MIFVEKDSFKPCTQVQELNAKFQYKFIGKNKFFLIIFCWLSICSKSHVVRQQGPMRWCQRNEYV